MTSARLGRLLRDRGAIAALEFALIAPMLLLTLFGAIELTELMACNRRAENAAASVADIISRDTVVEDDELDDLWGAVGALMYPDSAAPMQMRVSSVRIVSAAEARVEWSEGHNGYAARAARSTVDLPAGVMVPGSSVIVAETSYRYEPPIGVVLDLAFDLAHREYRRPRVGDSVSRDDDGGGGDDNDDGDEDDDRDD